MASTYSPNLRIELIGTGDQAGTWGNTTNSTDQYVLENAVSGYQAIPINSSNQALSYVYGSTTSAASNQAVFAFLQLTTGTVTTAFNLYAPPTPKSYIIYNNTSYIATIYNSTAIGNTTPAGAGVVIAANATITVWSDGQNFRAANTATGNFLVEGSLTVLGNDTEIGNFSAANVLGAFEQATFTGSISGNTLTVPTGGVSVGSVFVGQIISGTGIAAATSTNLTNPLSTNSGSAVVTVTQAGHGFSNGTPVTIAGASATGGIPSTNLNGTYAITYINANSYSFTAGTAASSTVSGGGGAITVTTPSTQITALGSGTGGAGTYFVNISQSVSSTTITGSPAAIAATPATTDNSNNVATTAFVKAALAASGSFVYPNVGIPLSTGAAWGTSFNNSTNPVSVSYGGTGLTSPGTANNALVSTGSGWTSSAIVNSISGGTGISITGSSGNYTISTSGASGVSSFNSRVGAVTPQSYDYSSYYYPLSSNPNSYASLSNTGTQTFAGSINAQAFAAQGASSSSDQKFTVAYGGYSTGISPTSIQIGVSGGGLYWDPVIGPNLSVITPGFGGNAKFVNSGYNYQGNNNPSWQTTSDINIKTNLHPITNVLEKINSLKPTHFEYKDKIGETRTGFIAQEFETVFPGHVANEQAEEKYLQYLPEGQTTIKTLTMDLIPYLVKAVQELSAKVDAQAAEIAILKGA